MTFAGGLVLWIFALLVTVTLVALGLREIVLTLRGTKRVEAWRRAGKAREPGEVLLEGTVWSDDQTPVARVPVFIYRVPQSTGAGFSNGGLRERQTGPAWSRPFWLSTEEGDVAVDAHPDVAEVELRLEGRPPLNAMTHDVVVGDRLEVFGQLVREHVAGAGEGGFRDGGASHAIHGDEKHPIHLSAGGTVGRTMRMRLVGAFVALGCAVFGAVLSQAALFNYEMRLLDGRVVRVTVTEREQDGRVCHLGGTYRRGKVAHRVSSDADASECSSTARTMPFLLSDLDPSNYEAGSDAHPDTGVLGAALTTQIALGVGVLAASMLMRRKRFPNV